ncbi:MAG: T9SS type A sorting domain-containing protein [Cytophagaceae bacterium]|nr:T9SS type A sorting domain-containing protein [Cytophagaceae bacterium]
MYQPAAGNSYAWTLPSGASVDGISNSNSITLDFSGFSGGNLVLTETSPNGCSRINTRSLTSLPVPAPNAINGLTNVIINSTNVNYTVNANAGNTYAWTLPGNASLVSGAGTTSILLNFNAVISSNTLTLVETNPQGCSNSQSITILLDKATQSISGLVNNLIKTYGDANQTLPLTASSGLAVSLVSDNPSVVSVNNFTLAFLDVGTVTLTASQAGDSYYKAAPDLTATVTVNKAGLTITIDNQSKVYGDPDPVFTHSYYGFVNGENTSVLDVLPTIAPLSLDAGNQAITGSGATDNHYSFIFVDGIYSISKAPLSISANNLSRGFGASNPSFTFSYVGFKNNENASVLDVLPIATSTAVPTSIPGTYPISVSGGSDNNYSFTLSDGILTVVSAIGPSLSVLPEDTGMCYGATVQLDAQLDNMQYRWFLRGNQISILKQPSLDESGIYVLEVEDPLGNIGRDTCRVQENTEPLGGSFLITYQAGSDDIVIVYDVSNPKPDSLQWNWGGGFAEKVGTQYRVQFTAAGTYTIQQTNFLGYCSQSISDNITVIPGKIFPDAGSMYSLMNVNAAPNPTSGEINITTNLEIEDQIQISVFDIYGNEQYSITSTEPAKIHTTTIDMSNWAVGNYNVRIISGTDLRVVKIEKL